MKTIQVVALGPDAARHMTLEAAGILLETRDILLRTGQHGVAEWLTAQGIAYRTLDALYDSAEDFTALREQAAQSVLASAEKSDSFCYGVPDPATDETVAALAEKGISLRVTAGVTQTAIAQTEAIAQAMPAAEGLAAIPAMGVAGHLLDPSLPLLVTELNSRLLASEVKLQLLSVYPPQMQVLFGTEKIALEDMDRQQRYSHLSTLYLPTSPLTERDRYTFGDLLDVMRQLRDPQNGCPWDKEQTHETLRQYLIEEAYEAVDAIDQGDEEKMADELGDVLLQVVFHAQVAQEHSTFDISDITTAICHKMISRHVHIFGDVVCETSEDVLKSWEAIKQKEKGLKATAASMQDVPGYLPALMRASKVQGKAHNVGFDWDEPLAALAKIHEETNEVQAELQSGQDPQGELGDLLFAVVNVARLSGVQPELALGSATEKFIRRFTSMEEAIVKDGKALRDMTLAEMDVYWDAVKKQEQTP